MVSDTQVRIALTGKYRDAGYDARDMVLAVLDKLEHEDGYDMTVWGDANDAQGTWRKPKNGC